MRLSEAIRLGATMKPQCFGDYFNGGGSCALGAAMDAVSCRAAWASPNDTTDRLETNGH